ncbi:MAG: LysM peptidoglycan-binding domain-containing protein [Bacilli bacterium]|nr:LysM peptidoglycan-binding domain-containing protein [Bacilli bacterium]
MYTVLPGDTMWNIALTHGIGLYDLRSANPHIKNPALIYVGELINLPLYNANNYVVKKGDTMWNIAKEYGNTLNELKDVNPDIKNPNLIYPEQTINIPDITNLKDNTFFTEASSTHELDKDLTQLENEVIELVNTERGKLGIHSLTPSNELSNVARLKSEDFIKNNYFSHNSPIYGSPFDMLRFFGVNFKGASENIASGQKTAKAVVDTWMNSSAHKANILNNNYDEIGVGIAKGPNENLYWTQIFIKK